MRPFSRLSARIARPESGFATIIALVLILILSLITVALAHLSISEYSTASALDRSNQAFLAAEAGVERLIADLKGDLNWGDDLDVDQGVTSTAWKDRYTDTPLAYGASFSAWLRHIAGSDPSTNMRVRSIGRARGAARSIEYVLQRLTHTDIVFYSINTVSTCNIPGGGSVQFHGSAYVEENMCLKGAAQAGFFNDRLVNRADAPNYFNNLYVNGNLDTDTGNPSIGTAEIPYWWLHVGGDIIGPSNNIYVVNFDNIVPPPFYPRVVDDIVRPAFELDPTLLRRGNELVIGPSTTQLVICRWNGSAWSTETSSDLILQASTDPAATPPPPYVIYLPRRGAAPTCSATGTPATVRAGGDYMLFWDGTVDPVENSTNLVFRTPERQIYVPGIVLIRRDVRYEGRGTVVVANQPTALVPANLQPQAGCALDFNSVNVDTDGLCNGNPSEGHSIKTKISPCQGTPGSDNPNSTYVSAAPASSDLAIFVVNGSAFSQLNSNACAQEMNIVAIVGDRDAIGDSICGPGAGACFSIVKKLQWYGVLMSRRLGLGQVPDFWQMPDLRLYLPVELQNLFQRTQTILQTRSWREVF